MNLITYLKYLCTHLTGRTPLGAQLHGQSLSILCKHSHLDRVDQHGHGTQTLLLDRVEHNQVPGREKGNIKNMIRMVEEWLREEEIEAAGS